MGSSYAGAAAQAPGKPLQARGPFGATAPRGRAQWVNWRNRTRPHRANLDDLSPAAAEHRHYHRLARHAITNPLTKPKTIQARRARTPVRVRGERTRRSQRGDVVDPPADLQRDRKSVV